jgi:hypothetical protein
LCRCGASAVVWSGNRDGPIWFLGAGAVWLYV